MLKLPFHFLYTTRFLGSEISPSTCCCRLLNSSLILMRVNLG